MTAEVIQNRLSSLFRYQETYWDSLPDATKEQCVNRQASRNLCECEAFDPAGPMREKWDTEIYPEVRDALNRERTTIFKRAKVEVSYAFHLYMIEQRAKTWPAFVAICIDIDVAKEIVKVVKKQLKRRAIGLKYLVFKSLLFPTGDRFQTSSRCGFEVEDESHLYSRSKSQRDLSRRNCTLGGYILVEDDAFGLTTAHSWSCAPPIAHVEIDSPNEIMWMSDEEEWSESYDTESLTSPDSHSIHKESIQSTSDDSYSMWEVSISGLPRNISITTLRSILPYEWQLSSVDLLSTRPRKDKGLSTCVLRFRDAWQATLAQSLLTKEFSAAPYANINIAQRRVMPLDNTLDLAMYEWVDHEHLDRPLPLYVDASWPLLRQSNLEDDWLLIPLERGLPTLPNVLCTTVADKSEILHIKGFLDRTPSDEEVSLCLGVSSPRRANLRTTATGLYLASTRAIIDVYTCNQATAAGDSGSWVVDDNGYVVGSILATCTHSYVAPMRNTIQSINNHNPGLTVALAIAELKPEPALDLVLESYPAAEGSAYEDHEERQRRFGMHYVTHTRASRESSEKVPIYGAGDQVYIHGFSSAITLQQARDMNLPI